MKVDIRPAHLAGLLVLVGLLASSAVATAQDGGGSGEESASADQTDTAESESGDQEQAAASDLPDPEDPMYWAKMRDVFTVQKRPFLKEGRFAATVYGGIIPNNIFEQYYPLGIRLNYFVLENIGVELAGSYALTQETGLQDTVTEEQGIGAQQILIADSQVAHTSFAIMWSPFYGKTSFYNSALNYFDLYLVGGAGLVVTQTQTDFNAPLSTGTQPKGVLGAGLAYYFGEHIAARLDLRQFIYGTEAGGLTHPTEVTLGGSWFF